MLVAKIEERGALGRSLELDQGGVDEIGELLVVGTRLLGEEDDFLGGVVVLEIKDGGEKMALENFAAGERDLGLQVADGVDVIRLGLGGLAGVGKIKTLADLLFFRDEAHGLNFIEGNSDRARVGEEAKLLSRRKRERAGGGVAVGPLDRSRPAVGVNQRRRAGQPDEEEDASHIRL